MAYFSQEQKREIAPKIKAILKKYGMKGTLRVDNHSTVILGLKSGPIDFGCGERGYLQVSQHYRDENFPEACQFLKEVFAVLMTGNHDNSDIQTDYFDVGWYAYVYVGNWDRPYILTK